jgi:hypothetical protein
MFFLHYENLKLKTYGQTGEWWHKSTILDLGGERSASSSGPFTFRETALGIHYLRGWVRARRGLDAA